MDTLAQMGGMAAPVPLSGQPQLQRKKTSLAACEQQNHEDSSLSLSIYIYLILTGEHFFIDSREREEV